MGYEQRLDTDFRPNLGRTSAEPVVRRQRESAEVTGIEKSAALTEMEATRSSSVFPTDRDGSVSYTSSSTDQERPSLSFADLIDVVNPLQHIPVVSSFYRNLTGDEISAPARVAGSTLFFGPVGAATSIANLAVEDLTGKDVGDHVVSLFSEGAPEDGIETADAEAASLQEQSATTTASSLAALDTNASEANQPLSPDEPFTFPSILPGPPLADSLETSKTVGFAGPSEPIALESLPSDILSALYSGQPIRPAGNVQGGMDAGMSPAQSDSNLAVDAAPRWNLWSQPNENLPSTTAAVRAYGGATPEDMTAEMVSPGSVANQGGWFTASMAEVLARYNDGASLQRQSHRPYVDVSQ